MNYSYALRVLLFVAVAHITLLSFATHKGNQQSLPQISQPGVYQGYSFQQYKGYSYSSHYIVTRDSVFLAADIYLPKHLKKGKKVPTILYLTRYVRSIQAKSPFNLLKDPL